VEALRERFGKYHVLEKIAQGGMAEVYKVKTIGIAGFEKIQALKRILPRQAREPRFIRSFIDEARIAVELTHRNIVQVFDFGKADGELFLAMELIEGKDLRSTMTQAVTRDLLPSVPIAAYIISEVAAGLDYAHRKADGHGGSLGIVHCDVSPSNVMLSGEGDIKILDFGIARATFASALERRRLRGKPRYMAPEQTIGETPTAASDVFALGIISWELLTGLPLYRGTDLKAILDAVRRTHPPRCDQINPAVPSEIADAVATALSREPAQRGTAADLAAACARSAMLAGSRTVAKWLAALDTQTARATIPWQPEVTSISVSPDDEIADRRHDDEPPTERGQPVRPTPGRPTPARFTPVRPTPALDDDSLPPSRPSLTISLSDMPAPLADRPMATARSPADTTEPGPRLEPAEITSTNPRRATPPALQRFDHEASTAKHPRYDVTATRSSAMRFDDDVTHQGALPASAVEDTHSDIVVEPGGGLAGTALGDAPIDDDLGAMAPGELAERRRIVIVVALLAGAAADRLRPVTKSLGELAYQRGGVVLELSPDALVVAFGLEIAGEDDVAIAMGWALDAAAMVRDTAADGEALTMRIGARAGVAIAVPAVAPAAVARGPEGGPRIPDDAIEEARALAREAAPDRPLFVGGAGRITSSLYALRELSAGRRIARRSRVIEVIGPRGFDERDRARLERRGNFVGRIAQLAELELWLSRAIAADRRLCVLITGPAGIGKSRLVAELIARRAQTEQPLQVTTAAASPVSRLAPFATVIDLYQAALGLPPARGRNARAQVVHRLQRAMIDAGLSAERARTVATDLDRAMELRDGIGVAAREVADLRPRISAGFASFRTVFTSRERPALTIVEDIHLADSASLEVLRHTLAMPAQGAELLVLTARPEGPPPPDSDAVLVLGDLVGNDLRALAADRLGDAASARTIATVLARSGGNPLFIEELAQAVRDAGAAGEDIPATARDVVSARLDRLPPKAKTALRFASVLGGSVRVRLLEELLGEHSLDSELEEVTAAGLLVRPAGAPASTEGELSFARGLVREVVYDSLSTRAQRDTHARVGRLLASRYLVGREEPPAAIAEHLERGGEIAGAAAFWLRAGRLALSASDADTAIAAFTRTLGLERELGATPPTATSKARRREALAGREEAHRLLGDLASDAGDLDELERLCAGEPARLADVAIRRAQRTLRLGDYAKATDATVVAEAHAITAGDDRLRGEALRVRGEVLERLGRFDEALEVVGTARELFHRQHAVADEMAAMVGSGRIHLLRARYEAARDAYRPVLDLIARTGDPWLERIVKNHVAVIEMCLGNFAAAMRSALRSLELCRRYGDRGREGDALSVAGIVLLEVGLHEQAAAMFHDALDLLSRTNSRWAHTDCLIYSGVCEQRRGRTGGLLMLDDAVAAARQLGARYLEANALVTRAGIHLRTGALSAAIADASSGATVAREATLVGYEIQGLARHALALSRLGNRAAEASTLAQRALELLDAQQYLEGSEEEVILACATVLRAAGAGDRAQALRERGRASARKKLAALPDPAWRAAYAAIPEIAELLKDPVTG
jgi:serine/threonine protein kinase/tetratricopeptide (TPR) repeat protein